MKRKFIYLASAALVAGLAACSSDDIDDATGLSVKEGELAASIESTVSTRVTVADGAIKWNRNKKGDNVEAIGVYGDNLNGYFEYDLKNGSEDQTKAVFTAKNKNAIANNFKPTLAFYPFTAAPNANVSSGEMLFDLPDAYDYTADEIPMPMVGDVKGSSIAFYNTAALLKVTVVNMPKDKNYAKLKSNKKSLSGSAKIDLSSTPYTLAIESGENTYVKYNATSAETTTHSSNNKAAFKEGATYDFYFVIPAGTYDKSLTFTLGAATSADDDTDVDDASDAQYSHALSISRNQMYSATLRYTTGGKIETGNLATLNEQLSEATTSASFKADLSTEGGTIYIPELANTSDVITLNLTLGDNANDDKAITIKSTSKNTPKVVVNVEQGVKTAAVDQTPAVLNDVALNIELPNSPVTLAPVGEAVTIKNVTADTYEDALTLSEGTTVGTLVLQNKTNVYVAEGAKIETDVYCDAASKGLYAFYQDKAGDIKQETTEDNKSENGKYTVSVGSDELYKLYYPVSGKEVTLKDAQEVTKEITVSAGKEVTINLATFELSQSTDSKSVIKVDGTLYIKGTTGSISSAKNVAAIVVNAGGKVYLQSGTITNSAAEAVQLNGEGAIFEMTDGKVETTKDNGDAITVTQGTATINITNPVVTDEVPQVYVKGDVAVSPTGKFELKNGYVDGTVTASAASTATGTAQVAISGGTLTNSTANKSALALTATNCNVEATISGGTVTSKSKTVVLTGDAVTASSSHTVTTCKLNVTGGTVTTASTTTTDGVIEDATGAASIAISGGEVVNAKGNGINLTVGSTVDVTGGKITAEAGVALNITKGTLNVTSGSPELTGKTVIAALGTAEGAVATINLTAAGAKYTSKGTAPANWVINNTTTSVKTAVITIEAGTFDGDITTEAERFITKKGSTFANCSNLYKNQSTYLKLGYKLSYDEDKDYFTVKADN